jgi:hypothetical protein
MSVFFEIAYAAVNNGLCLFTGTGFSKAVSDNEAPSWQGLLEDLCDQCTEPQKIKDSLFPDDRKIPLSLEEAAQVLSIELSKNEKIIHHEIADIIRRVELSGDNSTVEEFCKKQKFTVVTTNYDKLMEQLCDEADCQSLTPGLPVPRSPSRVKVYHIHGSVDVPENMVVTADDYFGFLNSESYFSRKMSTILHENTVVILGYSLGDTNLKAILSDYKGFSKNHVIGSNIFLVSRTVVDRPIKDYYSNCYGIRVIDNTDVEQFFNAVKKELEAAEKCAESSFKNIKKVVEKNHHFTEKYLTLENSFYEIVSSISATGYSLEHQGVVKMFGDIIEAKSSLTAQTGAWEQYTHLANWLIYIASILEIGSTSIEGKFLKAVQKSMESMSKELKLGYSWHAYRAWRAKWDGIIPTNRRLIRDYMVKNTTFTDAISIVNLG